MAAVGAEARGHINRHQRTRPLALALPQQGFDRLSRRPPLAAAQQGIDPEGGTAWIGAGLQPGNAKPQGVAQVGGAERLVALKRAPDGR